MGDRADGFAQHRAVFVFDYHEGHADDVPDDGWTDDEFLEQLRRRGWERQPDTPDPLRSCDPDIGSVDDLAARVRGFFVEENGDPDEVAQIPFDKLAALTADGWSFLGGNFTEFEGNHNDSEITVVLGRSSGT